jgi:uncharacterized membrane protein YhaH (DUF805 family)
MIGPIEALERYIFNAFTLNGRATRAEFWWANLILALVMSAAIVWDLFTFLRLNLDREPIEIVMHFNAFAYLSPFLILACIIPNFTLLVRRLHDSGRSGWWMMIQLVPFVGIFWYLLLLVLPSEAGENRWGGPNGSTRSGPRFNPDGSRKARPEDGYAVQLQAQRERTPAELAAHRAEIQNYYRSKVLNQA